MTTTAQALAAGMLWQMSSWATDSACLTIDAQMAGNWDADNYSDTRADALTAYCTRCPVAGPCLELALVLDVRVGIRGGLTPTERADYLGKPQAISQQRTLGMDES
jgi:hypothetical protein